jgi:hypothetical protein
MNYWKIRGLTLLVAGTMSALATAVLAVIIFHDFLTNGNWGLLMLMAIMLLQAWLYLQIAFSGALEFGMTQNPAADLTSYHNDMSKAGYPQFAAADVYDKNDEYADPGERILFYSHRGSEVTLKRPPVSLNNDNLPRTIRFRSIPDADQNTVLVYDRLLQSWMLYYSWS